MSSERGSKPVRWICNWDREDFSSITTGSRSTTLDGLQQKVGSALRILSNAGSPGCINGTTVMVDHCAECGKPLVPIHGTAHLRCCHGWGYWSKRSPVTGWPAPKHQGFFLYLNAKKWPQGRRATVPGNHQ